MTKQSDCAPSEDSDQSVYPFSLIRVLVARMKKPWVLSDLLSTQADLSLRWVHTHFVGFVMSRLKFEC